MNSQRKSAATSAVAALIGATIVACAPRPDPAAGPEPADAQALVARGAEVYGYSCGRCHNPRAAAERTDRSWEAIIDHMRVRANLTGGEARAVTAFMRALSLAPAERVVFDTVVVPAAGVPVDRDRGRELVASKGCTGCHIVAGKGGTVGPTLDVVFANRDSAYVRRKLRDPRFDTPNTVMPAFGLTDAEVDAIVAYLRSLTR